MNAATGKSPRISNPEFQTWNLNQHGREKVEAIRIGFDNHLSELKDLVGQDSRYLSLVKTNLELACFEAIKAVSSQPQNQE